MELQSLAVQKKPFLLRIKLVGTLFLASLQLLEPADLLSDGLEVREHTTKPTLGNVECPTLLRLLLNDRVELPLGTHEQDALAREDDLADGFLRHNEPVERLAQINDVDPVALTEDEFLHLRVPPASLVSEMDSSL